MRYSIFWLIAVFMLCSCESEDDSVSSITMQDGKTVTIRSSHRYYSNEEEFIHNVSFYLPRSCEYSEVEEIEYVKDLEGCVSGHNQFFIECWEIARFGEWIRNYGLEPNKVYYVATKVYAKYVSIPPNGLRMVPKLGIQFMGYCPDIEPKTFRANKNYDAQVSVLTTCTRYIGYDSEGKGVNCEIPSSFDNDKNKLTWKFLIREDAEWWD